MSVALSYRPSVPGLDFLREKPEYQRGTECDAFPRHFNSKEVVVRLPTEPFPLQIATYEAIRNNRDAYTKDIRKDFIEAATEQCLRDWGDIFPRALLLAELEKCDIHHVLYTCLGGGNTIDNLRLINKAVHKRIHSCTDMPLKILEYANRNGIPCQETFQQKIAACSSVTFNEEGNPFINLATCEDLYLIPQLFMLKHNRPSPTNKPRPSLVHSPMVPS